MELPKLGKQKVSTDILCGACAHPIIQDLDSGEWFHSNRDTKNACSFTSKTGTCKCPKASPFGANKQLVPPKQEPLAYDILESHEDGKQLPEQEFNLREVYSDIVRVMNEYRLSNAEAVIILEGIRQEYQVLYTLQNLGKNE